MQVKICIRLGTLAAQEDNMLGCPVSGIIEWSRSKYSRRNKTSKSRQGNTFRSMGSI